MHEHDYMQKAFELAHEAEKQDEVPVGAIVVYENEIIGAGYNQPISSCDPSAHAEIIAMRQAAKAMGNYRLVNADVYVTLEPCAMCAGAMVHARIKHLIFGAKDPRTGAVCSVMHILDDKSLNHRVKWKAGVMEQSCGELLKAFFKKRR